MSEGSACHDGHKCSVCYETIVDPRALPCGHSFCGAPRQCIDELETRRGIICGICRHFHKIKAKDIKPLYGIRDFFQVPDVKSSAPKCAVHSREKYSFWCLKCKIKVCGKCINGSHDGHSIRSLTRYLVDEMQQKLKKDFPKGLSAYVELAKQLLDSCDAHVLSLQNQITEIQQHKVAINEKKSVAESYSQQFEGLEFTPDNIMEHLSAVESFINMSPEMVRFPKIPSFKVNKPETFSVKSFEITPEVSKVKKKPITKPELKESDNDEVKIKRKK